MNTPQIMPSEHYQGEDEEGRITESADLGALIQINASEINQQIMTARAYPRSITQFRKTMREMVTLDSEVAQSCLYALKRSGKVIEGPSARFAEVAAQMWGNCRAGARVIDIGEEFVTAQGAFYDLEKNVAVSYEVLRRITNSEGNRFGADMIGVTGNAACSIAIRNAVLKGIPKAFWGDAYQQARGVAFGGGETIANRRANAIKAFSPWGIEPAQIYGLLGVKGADDITIDHLVLLGGIHQSIKDGEQSPEEAFAPENMQNPGEVAPRRPQRSEFDRKDPRMEKGGYVPETEGNKDNPPQGSAVVKSNTTDSPKAEEPKPEPATVESVETTGPAPDAFKEWFADQKTELANVTKIRDLADVRGQVLEQLDGFPDMEKEWNAACDARQQDILNATKKPKGK